MQFIRNFTWRILGLVYVSTGVVLSLLGSVLSPLLKPIDNEALLTVAGSAVLGIVLRWKLFQSPATLLHEIGHALAAASLGGQVEKIHVNPDTSGVTFSRYGRFIRLRQAFVSFAGPTACAVFFAYTARLVTLGLSAYLLLSIILIVVVITITTVRNVWGWITSISIVGSLSWVLTAGFVQTSDLVDSISTTVNIDRAALAVLSITAFSAASSVVYSWKCRKPRSESQDEAKFARALGLPPALGGWFILISVLVANWVGISTLLGWPTPWSPPVGG